MLNLALIKLLVDSALVMSLLFLSYRFMRSSRGTTGSTEVRQLERALRTLVSEAEEAGRTLDGQLQRRKGELEQALFDIDLAENKLQRAVSYAKSTAGEIAGVEQQAPIRPGAAARTKSEPAQRTQVQQTQTELKPSRVSAPTVQRQAAAAAPTRLKSEMIIEADTDEQDDTPISWGGTNIFGQPLGEGPEETVNTELARPRSTASEVEDIYVGAQEALDAGVEINRAAVKVNSSSEAQAMSAEIARQRDQALRERDPSEDTEAEIGRLGVLAPIKRHSQVV